MAASALLCAAVQRCVQRPAAALPALALLQAHGRHPRPRASASAAAKGPTGTQDWLDSLHNHERTGTMPPLSTGGCQARAPPSFDLARMQQLLEVVGAPQRRLHNVVHVVGSKGKGTVAAVLSAVLNYAGHRAGTYTSPHLLSVRERIAVGARLIGLKRQEYLRASFTGLQTIAGSPLVVTTRSHELHWRWPKCSTLSHCIEPARCQEMLYNGCIHLQKLA